MRGEWKTRCGMYAIVDGEEGCRFYGSLLVSALSPIQLPGDKIFPAIPTYWNKNGNSLNQAFDLVQRRRSEEEKW